MATILLQAAGAFVGGALGPLGAALGSAAGAMLGYRLDRMVIDGTRRIEGPRLSGARPFSAEEGASLPRVYGTMRVGGTMIWATRFEEEGRSERQGGKGGPRTTTYSYYANVAFALCEGEIAGVRRIWADGRELDLSLLEFRVHRGAGDQQADPLILAKQGAGNAPAYRGTAYVVFERLPLGEFGNRVPQLQFEVMRPVGGLNERIRAVCMIPGATEYGLSPAPVTREPEPGETVSENRHVLHAGSDIVAALDELQALCPALKHVALVTTWFGDDLRAGHCTIRPKVTVNDPGEYSLPWIVSGLTREAAQEVSRSGPGPAYGGTPADKSVMDAIVEIRSRGLKVTLYPFVMMDIPAGNALGSPYAGEEMQPAYPWRGRITSNPAPGAPGSADKTASARGQIGAFSGTATAANFAATGDTVVFSGMAGDWGYRRLVLHYARLAEAAGGVDAFLLGSELRGLTTLRDGAGAFPFVEQLCDLASEVRSILGPAAKITYGADWSEYFGYQPADGSGDVFFHLDPLWAHPDVDAVGIDCYMPLSDWRDADLTDGNPDGFAGPYDPAGLRAGIASGEGFDWYYAGEDDRRDRVRSPISDGAYGKHWTFRYKDMLGWWSNAHHNRPGGVESSTSTAWVPRSKPLWLTELGCPAIDKGPNQPNVFPDPKSYENAIPYFSDGSRSDTAQKALLVAHFDHWDGAAQDFSPAANPVSSEYGGRMLDAERIYCWAWDARPFPAFPLRSDVWSDGENWLRGHWLGGRLNTAELPDLVNAILADHGLPPASFTSVAGSLTGYIVTDPFTARASLEPLIDLFGLSVGQDKDRLSITGLGGASPLEIEELAVFDGEPAVSRTRQPDHDLPAEAGLSFTDPMRAYQTATARSRRPDAPHSGMELLSIPAAMEPEQAEALLAGWTRRRWVGREQVEFAVSPTRVDITPGKRVRLPLDGGTSDFLVTAVESGLARRVSGRRFSMTPAVGWQPGLPDAPLAPSLSRGAPLALLLDLPMPPGGGATEDQFRLAVRAKPWTPQAVFASSGTTGFERRGTANREAIIGRLAQPLPPGFEGRIDRAASIEVKLYSGELSSISEGQLLMGVNAAAIMAVNGAWEVLRFQMAEEIAPATWRLSNLLRGELGSWAAMKAGAAEGSYFVLLDEAVAPAGLRAAELGLTLNWKIGPLGGDFGNPSFRDLTATGGLRSRLPLPPVHIRTWRNGDGSLRIGWQRRSRSHGAQSLSAILPLGEETESYQLSIAPAGSIALRTVTVTAPEWTYPVSQIAADFPDLPTAIDIAVRQVSASVGAGDALSVRRTLL